MLCKTNCIRQLVKQQQKVISNLFGKISIIMNMKPLPHIAYLKSIKQKQMQNFTYSDELYSDLFKDANGFRPRGMLFDRWMAKSPAEKQREWDSLQAEIIEACKPENDPDYCFFHHSIRKCECLNVNNDPNWKII